ncbi:MAG: MFS transporter [Candidatus Nephrothrix sp. EaCA]|nr:MAG: MFS transporter [Candidatus Nephrothrix sp. EaCA]
MNSEKKNYVLPIAMMFALFFMIAFVTNLPNPMGVIVKRQFGASNFLSSLGNAANFIAYAFMGIPAGILLSKVGYKRTALLAIVVGFTGVGIQYLSGQMGSFAVYLIGAFVCGFSMCMLNTVVNPMLNTLGGGGNKGNQLIQFGGSLNSIAATIVPVLVGMLMGDIMKANITDANPALFIAMGIFALTFAVLFVMDIPEPHRAEATVAKEKSAHSPLSFRHFILGAIAIGVYVGIEMGIPNTTNLFMTSETGKSGLGIAASEAGAVVGTYWFLMLIGRLTGAVLGSKISSKAMLTFVSATAMALLLLAITSDVQTTVAMYTFKSDISIGTTQVPIGIIYLILCGLCTSVMWGGIFNLAVEGLGKYTAMASGIFMVLVCGGGIIPSLQGIVADSVGYIASYWVIFVCLGYLLFYALIGSKNVNKDIPVL